MAPAYGCRNGPPAYVARRAGAVRQPYARVDFIPQSGTKNLATVYMTTIYNITCKAGSLKMNTALEYSTRVVQEGNRRFNKSTLNDLVHLTPLRIPLMNPPVMCCVFGSGPKLKKCYI